MYTDTDVFVIGGGPAGLAAAIAARSAGLSVVVADGGTPPIDKPCGEGLLPESLAALAELGVQIPNEAGARFHGIRFLEGDEQMFAAFPEGHAVGIRRTDLHELLVSKAQQCGVTLLWRTAVTGIEAGRVQLAGETCEARWIVGADGSGSRVRRWKGLEEPGSTPRRFAVRRHYQMQSWTDALEIYWGRRAQAYVTPVAAEEVCVVVLADSPAEARFAESWKHWPSLQARLAGAKVASRDRGAITAMRSLPRVTAGNVALVGDASGSVDAITGDGLRLAFRHGLELAAAMKSGDLNEYERQHRKLKRRPTWMGQLMLFLSRSASARKRVFHSMARRPELFEQFLAIHVKEISIGTILGTGARLGIDLLSAR